jgi:hypothetical protein
MVISRCGWKVRGRKLRGSWWSGLGSEGFAEVEPAAKAAATLGAR